jgi:FemAB-related protein (PEP-CTERM system-associated)
MTLPLLRPPLALRAADLADPGEARRIEGFVRAHPDATPFHLPAWNRAVARGCGQYAHCLVAERANGSLAAILPLTEVRSPLFGAAMVSAGFAVDGGILAEEPAAVPLLADAAWRLAERHACASVELRGGALPEGGHWHRESGSHLSFARPLAADDEAELLAIPRKHRAEVRKGLANALEVHVGREDALADHYAVYAEMVRNLGTPVFPARLFREVLAACDADILTITHRGQPVASVLSLYFNGTVYPYWGGGTAAARALRANERLYFELMGHARRRGCTRFDFGRSKVGSGPAAYKKNWGFEGVPLRYAKRHAPGQAPRDVNPMSPRYQARIAAWRRLPLWLTRLIGPPIARGLG